MLHIVSFLGRQLADVGRILSVVTAADSYVVGCVDTNWSCYWGHTEEDEGAGGGTESGAASSQDAADGAARLYRHHCQSGKYQSALCGDISSVTGFSHLLTYCNSCYEVSK